MAYPYRLEFVSPNYIHPKTETGNRLNTGRFELLDPLDFNSGVVYTGKGEHRAMNMKYSAVMGEAVKTFLVFSITKLENVRGTPKVYSKTFTNATDRSNWIAEIQQGIQSGDLTSFRGGNIPQTLVSNDRIDGSTGLFLEGNVVFLRSESENRVSYFEPSGKLYGADVIVADNKQVSNFLTWELQITPRIQTYDKFYREETKTYGTGFERGQAYQPPAEPAVVSGVKPFEKPERVSVFQPKKTLLPQIRKIIDDWSVKKIIVPAWFANNNMNWVLEGRITEQEFLDAYTNLVNTGAITSTTPQVTIAPIPEITIPSIPEVSAVMELITTNFQVKLDNKIQFSSSLSNTDYKRLQDEMTLEPRVSLVFLNQTDFNPLSNFSKILRQIQDLLRGQVVETITISPTGQVITAPEPTVEPGKGLMGAGVLGIIGILMLGGFIADHVRRKR